MKKFILIPILLLACIGTQSQQKKGISPSESFQKYWYQGKAEINSYTLKQSRYGEIREGKAQMIFVTEPFRTDLQVKNESNNSNSCSVLKLNFLKKFHTGIYDYAMMLSVFSPVDQQQVFLKSTMSSQDWCGQSFQQVNYRDSQMEVRLHSYFESEGDQQVDLPGPWSEDAIYNQIRIDPSKLPVGKIRILPGSFYLRLMHKPIELVEAEASLINFDPQAEAEQEFFQYQLNYPKLKRTLQFKISYQNYQILEIIETYKDGFGPAAKEQSTVMTLDKTEMLPYWNLNKNKDQHYRNKLNLD